MNTLIYACPAMQSLAQKIVDECSPQCVLGDISWGSFEDGWPNNFIRDKQSIRGQDVVFLGAMDSQADVFNQLSVMYALPHFEARSLKVILPDFPTGTMERLDADESGEEQGKIATAKTLARMLSHIPLTETGPAKIVIFDIHALQEKFYFGDNVRVRLQSAMPLLNEYLGGLMCIKSRYSIVFPDEGADKRFSQMFGDYDKIYCSKKREGDKRHIRIESGSPKGRHCVIVDDRVLTGGTLIETYKELINNGADRVSIFVTHGVFPNESWKKFLSIGLDSFWITDSKPQIANLVNGLGPFRVISLMGSMIDQIEN